MELTVLAEGDGLVGATVGMLVHESVHASAGTNPTKLEVHPLVRHMRHSDTVASIGKIISLASEEVVDIGENDEVSDDDSIL
ncbi:hypothetical protein SCA6_010998, partial [Theobroma cacao]